MPSNFEKEFHRSGPGKYKDNHKTSDDVGLGSTESYKFSFKSKASNGTSVKTSQEVKHAGSTVTKLAMTFKKCNGFHLEKFEAGSDGAINGSLAFTEAGPGLDLTFGGGKTVDKETKQGQKSIYVGVNYVHDLLNANLKADYAQQSINGDLNVGYENFLLGATVDVKMKDSKAVPCWGGMIGTTFGNDSLLTFQSSKSLSELLVTGYFKPADGVELAFSGEQKGKDAKVVETKLRSKFSLDDDGTSLVASVTTTPLTVMNDDSEAKFRVGLSYAQKLRDWAKMKVSGEVGIKDPNYVAFGIELETGAI